MTASACSPRAKSFVVPLFRNDFFSLFLFFLETLSEFLFRTYIYYYIARHPLFSDTVYLTSRRGAMTKNLYIPTLKIRQCVHTSAAVLYIFERHNILRWPSQHRFCVPIYTYNIYLYILLALSLSYIKRKMCPTMYLSV